MRQLRDRGRPPLPAQSFLHLRGEPLHPAIDRAMVNRDAVFSHHRFEIAVTDRVRREFTTPAELCNKAVMCHCWSGRATKTRSICVSIGPGQSALTRMFSLASRLPSAFTKVLEIRAKGACEGSPHRHGG